MDYNNGGEHMVSEEFKKKIDLSVELIESCWDENNPNDGKTFDKRLNEVIENCEDETIKRILVSARC